MVREEIYRCPPPARLKVPILVQPVKVNDELPTEVEFELAVRALKVGRAGGLSVMRVEDLKGLSKEDK